MIKIQWRPPSSDRMDQCQPITCTRKLCEVPLANRKLRAWMQDRVVDAMARWTAGNAGNGVAPAAADAQTGGTGRELNTEIRTLTIYTDSWLSADTLRQLLAAPAPAVVLDRTGERLAWTENAMDAGLSSGDGHRLQADSDSFRIQYAWDLLRINEILVGGLEKTRIAGECSPACTIDGFVSAGPGTRILAGVYIEGKVLIGADCKIGPNCYLRGNTSIGDGCHIGQAVEIKNSLIMNGVSIGHLSYCGDSIIGERVNFGAGTVTANLRHDGRPHSIPVDGQRHDTGRLKLGTIMGDDVHTGIHTSIYPGRMFWPDTWTRPGQVVSRHVIAG